MIDISNHPVWKKVSPYKKPFHLLRIHLARQYAKLFPGSMFIGVTGSVGKTTTVIACRQVLSQKYKSISTAETSQLTSNLDPIFNIPMTILRIAPSVEKVVLEMGVEYPGDMDINLSFVKPTTVIVTRLSIAHSEFLGGIEDIVREKRKLVDQLPKNGLAILNFEDPTSKKLIGENDISVVYFGKDPQNCLVWAGNVKTENFRTAFELNHGVERVKVDYQLLGEHQIYPALAAAALGVVNNIPLTKIKIALESIGPSEHRLQPVSGPNGSVILDDTYNSSPAAVEAAIDTLLEIPARRRVLVLGEMRELGEESEQQHRLIARKIYREKIDLVFLGQGDAKIISEELKALGFLEERLEDNLQNSHIVSKLLKNLGKGDVCLIKGSRAVRLDEVVKRITKNR
ncbi:UDP-N-acetylmuramoyl-tripeptide--D-alanyl-D-alanine ligase [Candidatus Daviesbacteria bacterium]|nr:UDP-N-acetylmuramoyl-tripeptide--D-alanyl-D-alanine ligase [Candidatus Daviesbacteria bacterium]